MNPKNVLQLATVHCPCLTSVCWLSVIYTHPCIPEFPLLGFPSYQFLNSIWIQYTTHIIWKGNLECDTSLQIAFLSYRITYMFIVTFQGFYLLQEKYSNFIAYKSNPPMGLWIKSCEILVQLQSSKMQAINIYESHR